MKKFLTISAFILVWLLCGTLGSIIGLDTWRMKRDITYSDLPWAVFAASMGPINLLAASIYRMAIVSEGSQPKQIIWEKRK